MGFGNGLRTLPVSFLRNSGARVKQRKVMKNCPCPKPTLPPACLVPLPCISGNNVPACSCRFAPKAFHSSWLRSAGTGKHHRHHKWMGEKVNNEASWRSGQANPYQWTQSPLSLIAKKHVEYNYCIITHRIHGTGIFPYVYLANSNGKLEGK